MQDMVDSLAASGAEMVTVAIRRLGPGQPGTEHPGAYQPGPVSHPAQHRRLPHRGRSPVRRPPGPRSRPNRLRQAGSHPRRQIPVPRPQRHPPKPPASWSRKASKSCPTSTPTPFWRKTWRTPAASPLCPSAPPSAPARASTPARKSALSWKTPPSPVVVDAGLAVPSDAARALEMGADAVLVNTAIAQAQDPALMADAFARAWPRTPGVPRRPHPRRHRSHPQQPPADVPEPVAAD